jgi:hypothetical protein
MEWRLEGLWRGVYATIRNSAPNPVTAMITTNSLILALLELHTMAVAPYLSIGMHNAPLKSRQITENVLFGSAFLKYCDLKI